MNINNQPEHQPAPWYRIGMVWLMIGLPAVVVIASLVTVIIAHQHAPEITTQQQRKNIN
jgi:hypothetical protein